MRRPLMLATAASGLALIAAAIIVHATVAPAVAQLPANTNTTRTYSGVAAVLFDPAALAPGSTAPLVLRDVPLQIAHQVRTLRSTAHASLVSDTRTVTASGTVVAALADRYVVNRRTLEPSTAISTAGLTHQVGLTFSWPIGVARHDYQGWVPDTGATTTLHYAGTQRVRGIDTFVFTASVPAAPITDPQVLAGLPRSLPKAALPNVVSRLGLPAAQLAQLATFAAEIPAVVPLSYTYQAHSTYWVAPASGVVVNLSTDEIRTVNASVQGFTVPIAPVAEFRYSDSPATLTSAVKDARTAATRLTLIRTTGPIVLGALGLLLLGAATVGTGRRRARARTRVLDVTDAVT
ncbi:MAG TPA: porin PorA family protein, partial [Mycobacteriales bacterium]|nr:porin PorA family protein [Mycobacteriales bacterium]